MRSRESDPFAVSIIQFCQFARVHGLTAGVDQTLAALQAAQALGESNWEELALALRTALASSKEEWDLFQRLFDAFWADWWTQSEPASADAAKRRDAPATASSAILTRDAADVGSSLEDNGKGVAGASAERKLQQMDFSNVPLEDLPSLEKLSRRLFRRMSLRLSRRLKIKELAGRVDIRRTIRRSIPRGGDPIVLAFRRRRPEKQRLVIFLDISGSMNAYSLFLLRFAYALQNCFKRVDTFLFSTEIVEISRVLRTLDLPRALSELAQQPAGWAGGTKIGESLRDLCRRHSSKLLSRNTVFIILSDGWDTGEPQVLADQLRQIAKRVEKVVWLNPLLGLKDYEPLTRGMAAALPYADVFAPAHNLESLLALERFI